MGKICIILNSQDKQDVFVRLKKLYDAGEESYAVSLRSGFTNEIQAGTTEVLFSGGSSIRLKDHPELKDEMFKFIQKTDLPVIGICFGAQAIARAMGSRIVKLPKPCTGLGTIRVISQKDRFDNRYVASVYKNQHWSLQNLPPEFEIMAVSGEGIEMFRHKTRPLAGIQFHPEQFPQVGDGKLLFKSLRSLMHE